MQFTSLIRSNYVFILYRFRKQYLFMNQKFAWPEMALNSPSV